MRTSKYKRFNEQNNDLTRAAKDEQNTPGKLFQTLLYFLWEYCCLNFDLALTPYKLLNHACMGNLCHIRFGDLWLDLDRRRG